MAKQRRAPVLWGEAAALVVFTVYHSVGRRDWWLGSRRRRVSWPQEEVLARVAVAAQLFGAELV